jgi:hypothetical protein
MSDGGRVKLYLTEETVTWGTTPSVAMDTIANAVSETLGQTQGSATTNAIRGDYVKPAVHRVKLSGTGDIAGELAYGDWDKIMAGVFRGTWTAGITNTAVIYSFDNANNLTRSSGSFITDGYVKGQWIKISGFVASSGSNNGFYRIATVTSATALALVPASGITSVTEAAGPSVTVKSDGMLRNGTTLRSYTIERNFADLTNRWIAHKGQRPNMWKLAITTGQLITSTFTFDGKVPIQAAASQGSGSFNAPVTGRVMNAIDNITGIMENGSLVTVKVSQINLNIGAPNRPIETLGTIGPQDIRGNSFAPTGDIRMFWDDNAVALYNEYLNFTSSSVFFRLVDSVGSSYVVTLPALHYTGGNPNVSGVDADVVQTLAFTVEYDSATSTLMQIDRFI